MRPSGKHAPAIVHRLLRPQPHMPLASFHHLNKQNAETELKLLKNTEGSFQ